jgi:hypothetical protein
MKYIKLFEEVNTNISEEDIENMKEILYYLSDECKVDFEIKTTNEQKHIFIFDEKVSRSTYSNGEIDFNVKFKKILDKLIIMFIEEKIYFEMILFKTSKFKKSDIKFSLIDIKVDNLYSGHQSLVIRKNNEFEKNIKSITDLGDSKLCLIRIELKWYSKHPESPWK